jgi:hypothetical protein
MWICPRWWPFPLYKTLHLHYYPTSLPAEIIFAATPLRVGYSGSLGRVADTTEYSLHHAEVRRSEGRRDRDLAPTPLARCRLGGRWSDHGDRPRMVALLPFIQGGLLHWRPSKGLGSTHRRRRAQPIEGAGLNVDNAVLTPGASSPRSRSASGRRWTVSSRKRLSERLTDASARSAVQGEPHGGKQPWGLEDDQVRIKESEAGVCRSAARSGRHSGKIGAGGSDVWRSLLTIGSWNACGWWRVAQSRNQASWRRVWA